jgi:hypothetical protein
LSQGPATAALHPTLCLRLLRSGARAQPRRRMPRTPAAITATWRRRRSARAGGVGAIGLFFGRWLDGRMGTADDDRWLVIGFTAGTRAHRPSHRRPRAAC